MRPRGRSSSTRIVGADEQQPASRYKVDEPAERKQHLIEVRVDVRVIELDVVDDGDVGKVLEKLGRLVEERAVVLVPFDDEVASLPQSVTRPLLAEIQRDPANEHTGVNP